MPQLRLEQVRMTTLKLDGKFSYGYDEEGVLQLSWDALPTENGGAYKTLLEIVQDMRDSLAREGITLIQLAIGEKTK